MADIVEIARNLLTLEINTVVKEGMSAHKMPEPAQALVDIYQTYHQFLCEQARFFGDAENGFIEAWVPEVAAGGTDGHVLQRVFGGKKMWGRSPFAAGAKGWFGEVSNTVDKDRFDDLREVAAWLRGMRTRARKAAAFDGEVSERVARDEIDDDGPGGRPYLNRENDAILARIQRFSDQFKEMLEQLGGRDTKMAFARPGVSAARERTDFTISHLVLIRKAWEVGTEQVVMQTVIQIDGDVISRIAREKGRGEGDVVLAVHRDAVQIAVGRWHDMVDLVRSIGGAIAQKIWSGSG